MRFIQSSVASGKKAFLYHSVAVFCGGALGAGTRIWIGTLGGSLCQTTLVPNCLACFLLAWGATRYPKASLANAFFATGFCGALSTFSTFSQEIFIFAERDPVRVIVWILLMGVTGMISFLLGERLGRRFSQ